MSRKHLFLSAITCYLSCSVAGRDSRPLMPEPSSLEPRFLMVGARAAVLGGPIAEAIEQQIHAIENALASVPDFAFDLSKTLVESVCKTVLADIGQPAGPNWDALRLLKETTSRLT